MKIFTPAYSSVELFAGMAVVMIWYESGKSWPVYGLSLCVWMAFVAFATWNAPDCSCEDEE